MTQPRKRKLIEVALPLDAINKESAREKSIRHGHPSTLHLWWARRPLASCRAVIFSSLVDDPSSHPDKFPSEASQEMERKRLFKILEDLVKWENSNNETVLEAARQEILKSTDGNPPPIYDPFCGGGSIPLEAQRLGLKAYASDLNPVAVLITKALIEFPPKFAGLKPVSLAAGNKPSQKSWKGAEGLAEDVRFFGEWMKKKAEERIGKLYPKVKVPGLKEDANVIAWIWTRTVKCPNPACGCEMPLVRSFELSKKKGKEAYVDYEIDRSGKVPKIEFSVKTGKGKAPDGSVNRKGGRCIACNSPVPFDHIRSEGKAGRMSQRMMAIVAEGKGGRAYLSAIDDHVKIAKSAKPDWIPDADLPHNPRDFKTPNYGMRTFGDLFTKRQLVALNTFCDLVGEARELVLHCAKEAKMKDDGKSLEDGGTGATAYADAVAVYLGMLVSKFTDYCCSLNRWQSTVQCPIQLFSRHAIPMVWDFAEGNPLGSSSGSFSSMARTQLNGILSKGFQFHRRYVGEVRVQCATSKLNEAKDSVIITDPPYYDNIGYADLSDFFYITLRKSLCSIIPSIFQTILVPKSSELVSSQYRFESKDDANQFFQEKFGQVISNIDKTANREFPRVIFYAYKQQNEDLDDVSDDESGSSAKSSLGWESMLEGLLAQSSNVISGTWPLRTERVERILGRGTNALASSIAIGYSWNGNKSTKGARRDFIIALQKELKNSLATIQKSSIAPVDLAQAAIGPGMAVFSSFGKVLESSGEPMSVRTALVLINQVLDEVLSEQEGQYDPDTRWAISWFEQHAFDESTSGDAITLCSAKNTSLDGLVSAGIVAAKAGKTRLLKRDELPADWDPKKDNRLTVWEATQHLIRALEEKGEAGFAELSKKLGPVADEARNLAYRLYSICERNGWAEEAQAYNALVVIWSEALQAA